MRALSLDTRGQTLALSDGSQLAYDKLLIATGSVPLPLHVPGADRPGVQPLWTLDHTAQALAAIQGRNQPRVVLIGAGFIGLIVLNALAKRRCQLTVVERDEQVLPRMLNAEAAGLVREWLTSRGVDVRCGTTVRAIYPAGAGVLRVELTDGNAALADLVIVATGVQPNLQLVAGTDVATDVGILVNGHLETSCPNVYAAGDVAEGPVLFSDHVAVHAIQPTAVDHGRVAGANMAGHLVEYPGSLSMNVLDVCGLQCASFGHWSQPGVETTTVFHAAGRVYRTLVWTGDRITGAIFVGRAGDLGMLTDVGMVKGIMQTHAHLGPWKEYLAENPLDIRRPFVAARVAERLVGTTLLGRPSQARLFPEELRPAAPGASHAVFVGTRVP